MHCRGKWMINQREPTAFVQHAIDVYHRGYVCPAEMWFQIASVLTPQSATAALEALPPDAQEQLRSVFADRPSLPSDPSLADVVEQITVWCQGNSDGT